ncbi:MAG: maleylacetoacetate isomerase [Myxococcota bacterium]
MGTPRLHGHPRSSATARVRIALGLKKIEYEFREVALFKHENLGEAYRAVNPLGQVPALEIDGVCLTQSVAICEYLEETRPDPALLPGDPVARAQCRELVEIINAGVQPLQNKGVLEKLVADYDDAAVRGIFAPDPSVETKGDNWPQYWIRKGLAAFEAKVAVTAGRYCIGDTVTLADVVLAPQATGSRLMYKLDLAEFPTVARIHAALAEVPAFREVRPEADR